MLEKLKAFAESAKNMVLFVLGPILAVLGYVVYLRSKNTALEDQIASTQAADHLAKTLDKKVEDEKVSEQSAGDYESLRTQYLSEHPEPSSGLPGSDKGSGQSSS